MGCGCNFGNKTEEKLELINNELTRIEESIKSNKDLENSIIKIQSNFRGMQVRSKIKNLDVSQNNYNVNVTSQSQLVETNTFHPSSSNLITREELENLLNEYPPLNDDINVIINGLIQYENNNSIYYGEWDSENNLRHGRGIQLWSEGSKY